MQTAAEQQIKELGKKAIRTAVMDVAKSAAVVNLTYVNDTMSGISREREGDTFAYFDGKKKITKQSVLDHIKKLAIPPAWEQVWICKDPAGHLQATGLDAKGRKQYRYHPLWNSIRNTTKFYRLRDFGKQLPAMRAQIHKHLALPGYPKEKILALVVSLLERTNIRIGNGFYERLYGSFGLTTLKNDHVKVNGTEMTFTFTGKKGVKHNISIRSKKLANIVKGCRDIPGKHLFEFIDENGHVQRVDSGMVNAYIHSISGNDFSAKDFRTWAGSTQALIALGEAGDYETNAEFKEKIVKMFDHVACALGNTRAVCRKYYVHPLITELYEGKKLKTYLEEMKTLVCKNDSDLHPEECVLLKILEKN
jgi:DNA topoisomerase I